MHTAARERRRFAAGPATTPEQRRFAGDGSRGRRWDAARCRGAGDGSRAGVPPTGSERCRDGGAATEVKKLHTCRAHPQARRGHLRVHAAGVDPISSPRAPTAVLPSAPPGADPVMTAACQHRPCPRRPRSGPRDLGAHARTRAAEIRPQGTVCQCRCTEPPSRQAIAEPPSLYRVAVNLRSSAARAWHGARPGGSAPRRRGSGSQIRARRARVGEEAHRR
ncbi:unnamed protein product [Urochloa humidicola]